MPFHQLEGVEVCQFKAREYLMRRGDPMPYVYYLKRGVVNREILSKEGSILITTIKESGGITSSIVGLLEIFADYFEGKCTDDFVAVTDCVCYRIPVQVCKDYMRAHPALLEETLAMCINLFDDVEKAYSKKKDMSAASLVCEFLLLHYEVIDGKRLVAKKYTNVKIGKYVGVHSVTVSRVINCLRRNGVVARQAQGLEIMDVEGIRAYLRGEKKIKYD